MGIMVNPNNIEEGASNKKESEFVKKIKSFEVIKETKSLLIPLEHIQVINKMILQYKNDALSMFRDKKLNIYFWTKNQI